MINDYEATKPITTDAETTGTAATTAKTVSNEDVISTVNGLIETCKDGQNGFKESAEAVTDSNLKTLFYELSQQRSQFTGELQELVRGLGGDPENSGSVVGALHRGWINLKSAITGNSDGAILNEAERGEDAAKKAYKDALETNLPANISSIVQNQYAQVQTAHDKVRDLRDSVNGKS